MLLSLPWLRVRRRRADFRRERQGREQSDADFLAALAPPAPSLTLILRETVARMCGVPARAIHADDPTTRLELLLGSDTLTDFILAIPMGLPESANSCEFFWDIEAAVRKRTGVHFSFNEPLQRDAMERWLAGEAFGAWASCLARAMSKQFDVGSEQGKREARDRLKTGR